jgi:hypothetical protein
MPTQNIEIKVDDFLDMECECVKVIPWKFGTSRQYLVNYNSINYLTEWLQYHYDDGLQAYDSITLFPAEQVSVKTWKVIK